jgi:hypothetical protein
MPDTLPPAGQIRTDGQAYAIYLPAGLRDWAPWHILHGTRQFLPVTHQVVRHWRVLGSLADLLTPPAPAPRPAAEPARARTFTPGQPRPDDVAGVLTPDGQIWPACDWDGVLTTWEELLALHGPVVEIPTKTLLCQLPRTGTSTDRLDEAAGGPR